MSNVTSRITNVIETIQDDNITYFTLEGVMIGGFKGGVRIEPEQPEPTTKAKPQGGVITSKKPAEVERQKELNAERNNTPENRLKNLKDNVA